MNNKGWLLLIIVLIIALIAVVVVYYFLNSFPSEEVPAIEDQGIIPPGATGDISSLENALNKEMMDEDILIEEESFDTDLVESDNVEIDNFGQSLNENEL